jgi:hypothetical protein
MVDHVLLGHRGEEVRSRNYLVPLQKREQLGAQAVTARRGNGVEAKEWRHDRRSPFSMGLSGGGRRIKQLKAGPP